MTANEARARAIAAGATESEIDAETIRQSRHKSTVPFKNMIRALQMLPYLNNKADWTRLAGALHARAGR